MSSPFEFTVTDWKRLKPAEHLAAVHAKILSVEKENAESLTHREAPWDRMVLPILQRQHALLEFWSPLAHLHAVNNSAELRAPFVEGSQALRRFEQQLYQNPLFYEGLKACQPVSESAKRAVQLLIQECQRAGVALAPPHKVRLQEIESEIQAAAAQFGVHLLDATADFSLLIEEESRLDGLPDAFKQDAALKAKAQQRSGWLITLEPGLYSAVMMHCHDRALRATCYAAWSTRASDQGPSGGVFDNREGIHTLVRLRAEKAALLGYPSTAAYTLDAVTAQTPDRVSALHEALWAQVLPVAEEEVRALGPDLQPWDVAYRRERSRSVRFGFNDEEISHYFPLKKVCGGLFTFISKLFGLRFIRVEGVPVWHPSVQFFKVVDQEEGRVSGLYLDLFARPGKSEGAWMDEHRGGEAPVAMVICNFTPSRRGLTPYQIETLFHEMGHALQLLCNRIDLPCLAGGHRVPWDVIEVPSQFLEAWCWHPEVVPLLCEDPQGKLPPPEVLETMRQVDHGLLLSRQLLLGEYDLQLHRGAGDPFALWRRLSKRHPLPESGCFPNTFAHIFEGSYASGYYGYLWAEQCSAALYARFHGRLEPKLGRRVREEWLSQGGLVDVLPWVEHFCGAPLTAQALLKQRGL